jgi:hypothetical protein
MLFQSTRSSNCAVCAIGNLASLYGLAYTREEIYRAIEALGKSSASFINHQTLSAVVRNLIATGPIQWHRRSKTSHDWLRRSLWQVLKAGTPTLLTFQMKHKQRDWAGVHCVVVVAVDENGIHVIDSLGCRCGCMPNATIFPKESSLGWKIKGAPIIVTKGPAHILLGLPAF